MTTTLKLGDDAYSVRLELAEDFHDLERWLPAEADGRWTASADGMTGEWLRNSPSIFLREKVHGDYLWQIKARRIQPDPAFLERHEASNHGRGKDPVQRYNFNFWLRADTPDGKDFFETYTEKLGTGWNGMGDDYWNSFYVTVVRDSQGSRVRLRKSPGYRQVLESFGVVPYLPYGEEHTYTFLIREGRVKMYLDQTRVFDCEDAEIYESGYIGLCVWLAVVRFEQMRLYRFV